MDHGFWEATRSEYCRIFCARWVLVPLTFDLSFHWPLSIFLLSLLVETMDRCLLYFFFTCYFVFLLFLCIYGKRGRFSFKILWIEKFLIGLYQKSVTVSLWVQFLSSQLICLALEISHLISSMDPDVAAYSCLWTNQMCDCEVCEN